jgi:hypothetical protein
VFAGDMLVPILEHVDEGVANLTRRGQGAAMPAIRPEAATTREDLIDATGNADH